VTTRAPAPAPVTRRTTAGLLAATLSVGLLSGGVAGWVAAASAPARSGACDVAALADAVLPAVVTVFADGPTGSGSGSGAILTPDGTIVTNDHVIDTAGASGQLAVQLTSGAVHQAALVGTDPKTDLAVLRIEAGGLPTLPIGDDTRLRVGQPVVALGAPLGLSGTVTAGIVSALDRDIVAPTGGGGTTVLAGNIQTDAAINPGNSGGPLVDCSGRLVGVNTAISTVPDATGVPGGGSVGIGFAVPAGTVRRITDELVATGRATHPWFGMAVAEVPPSIAARFSADAGLYVQSVVPAGPAAAAGLRASDLIVSVADAPASSFALGRLLARAAVGEEVALGIVRDGQRGAVSVVLAEAP